MCGLLGAAALRHWRGLTHLVALHSCLDGYSLTEAVHWVLALKFLKLCRCVLVKEFVNGEETSTNTDVNLVLVDSDVDFLGTELVDTLRLSQEHDLELGPLWVIVDVLG